MRKVNDQSLKPLLAKEPGMRLFYVAGNDEFLVDSCVRTIARSVRGGTDGEAGMLRLDAAKSDDQDIEQPFSTYTFAQEPRVLLLNGGVTTLPAPRLALLSGLVRDIPEDITVIFRHYTDDAHFSAGKKIAEFTALNPHSVLVEALAKKNAELENYIAALIKRAGCTARDAVARRLVELCGDDLLHISNEVEKLAAAADYGEITEALVNDLCVRTAEAGVYDMISQIEKGDTKAAMRTLGEMLDDRNEPLGITAALNTAVINYYRARLARDRKLSEKQLTELFAYKENDRKVSIAYSRCTKFSLAQLERAVAVLSELDLALKSSAVDDRILLETGTARLIAALGGRL